MAIVCSATKALIKIYSIFFNFIKSYGYTSSTILMFFPTVDIQFVS